jgi:hypothetical protein
MGNVLKDHFTPVFMDELAVEKLLSVKRLQLKLIVSKLIQQTSQDFRVTVNKASGEDEMAK